MSNEGVFDMFISGGYVYILARIELESYIMKIDASTQHTSWVKKGDAISLLFGIIKGEEDLSIISSPQGSDGFFKSVHDQFDSSLTIDGLPTFNQNSSFEFGSTDNPQFDLVFDSLYENGFNLEAKAIYTSLTIVSETIDILQSDSYVILMPQIFTQNITVTVGQNYTENISLPCSAVTYDNLSYATYDNGIDEIPNWVTPDYAQFTLDIRVPVTNKASNHTYMIETTYPDGTVINYFYIFVIE